MLIQAQPAWLPEAVREHHEVMGITERRGLFNGVIEFYQQESCPKNNETFYSWYYSVFCFLSIALSLLSSMPSIQVEKSEAQLKYDYGETSVKHLL